MPRMEELNADISIPIVESTSFHINETASLPEVVDEQSVMQEEEDNLWKNYDTSRLSQSEMGKRFINELKAIQKLRKAHLRLGPKKMFLQSS